MNEETFKAKSGNIERSYQMVLVALWYVFITAALSALALAIGFSTYQWASTPSTPAAAAAVSASGSYRTYSDQWVSTYRRLFGRGYSEGYQDRFTGHMFFANVRVEAAASTEGDSSEVFERAYNDGYNAGWTDEAKSGWFSQGIYQALQQGAWWGLVLGLMAPLFLLFSGRCPEFLKPPQVAVQTVGEAAPRADATRIFSDDQARKADEAGLLQHAQQQSERGQGS